MIVVGLMELVAVFCNSNKEWKVVDFCGGGSGD